MNDQDKSKAQLIEELTALRKRVAVETPLDEKTFDPNHQFLTLLYAGATIASSLDLQFVLDTFVKEMVGFLKTQGCVLSRWNSATNEIIVIARDAPDKAWWPERSFGMACDLAEFSLAKGVLLKRHAKYITLNQPNIKPAEQDYLLAQGSKTLLILPMEIQDHVIGLVEIMNTEVIHKFSAEEVALTQFLANQAAMAIYNAQLYAQVQQELAERRQAEQELRKVAARNQVILDTIPDSLFFLSRDGDLLDYKISNQDDLPSEVAEEEIVGQKLGDALRIPSDKVEQVLVAINKALDTQRVQVFEYQRPDLFNMQDFEARLVASGKNEILAIVRNITGRKQTERHLIRTERLAALGQLAAALAHEINNPLQAMQSNLDLMLNYPLTPTEREKYLHVIRRQIERVTDITRHVLNFTRPQLQPRQGIAVVDCIQEVLILTRKQLEQNKIDVVLDSQPNIPLVLAAPQQLTQVFLNLIINAIEARTNHNDRLNITIYREDDEVVISFTNTGAAIPPEILPHIFEPFFTTKSEGQWTWFMDQP